MINLLIGGIGLGCMLSLMLGPVFFVLLETSIQKGIRSALFLDLGVFISDIMYISIAYVFVNQVANLQSSGNIFILPLVGGLFFIIFGIVTLKKKVSLPSKKELQKSKNLAANNVFSTILKGFFLNAVNPGVLFYWLTIIGTLRDKTLIEGFSENGTVILYLIVILGTFFGIDIFKIIGAKKLKNILTPDWMRVINKTLGIVLVCFGVLFIMEGLYQVYYKV